jgi:hypothetical protein
VDRFQSDRVISLWRYRVRRHSQVILYSERPRRHGSRGLLRSSLSRVHGLSPLMAGIPDDVLPPRALCLIGHAIAIGPVVAYLLMSARVKPPTRPDPGAH